MLQDPESALSDVLLERLQDIHAAAEPSWWPPAPGWWVVAGIVLAAFVYLALAVARKLRGYLRRRRLLRELDGLAEVFDPRARPAEYLAALNRLFRAIALRAFPDTACARLQGDAWVAFIRQRLPRGSDAAGLEVLSSGPYQSDPDFDAARLRAHARQWVMRHG